MCIYSSAQKFPPVHVLVLASVFSCQQAHILTLNICICFIVTLDNLYYLIWVIINDEHTTSIMALLLSASSILPLFLSYSLVCYSTIKLHTQLGTVDFISRSTTCIRVDENQEFDASLKGTES